MTDYLSLARECGADIIGGCISFSKRELATFASRLAPASEAGAVARYKSEFAEHVGNVNAWARQWETSGVSRSQAIQRAMDEIDRLHWEPCASPAEPAGAVELTDSEIARLARKHIDWTEQDGEIEFARACIAASIAKGRGEVGG